MPRDTIRRNYSHLMDAEAGADWSTRRPVTQCACAVHVARQHRRNEYMTDDDDYDTGDELCRHGNHSSYSVAGLGSLETSDSNTRFRDIRIFK